jgi:hypothetical protein
MADSFDLNQQELKLFLNKRFEFFPDLLTIQTYGPKSKPFYLIKGQCQQDFLNVLLRLKGAKNSPLEESVEFIFDAPESFKEFLNKVLKIQTGQNLLVTEQNDNLKIVFESGDLLSGCFYLISKKDAFSPIDFALGLDKAGFNHMPAPVKIWPKEDPVLIITEPVGSKITGWQLAKGSLRDFFDQGGSPEEAGASLQEESAKLGEMLARLHSSSEIAFGSKPGSREYLQSCKMLSFEDDILTETSHSVDLDSLIDLGGLIKTHGSISLENVVRTDMGWVITDFGWYSEGFEFPGADLIRVKNSYILSAKEAVSEQHPDDQKRCISLAKDWLIDNLNAFTQSYLKHVESAHIWPTHDEEKETILRSFGLSGFNLD